MTRHPQRRPRYRTVKYGEYVQPHLSRREADEMACSCGKRWPVGEDHP